MIRYKYARRLAVGGMAEVLLAQQQGIAGFEKLVVVKRILPHLRDDGQFLQMLLSEARLAASLRHPNIIEIYDVHRDEDDFYIVMEYLSGEDLRTVLRTIRRKKLSIPIGIVCRVIADAAAGLDFAHRATDPSGAPLGIVHRDVGPTNIVVTFNGVTKVLDFGVAKANVHNIYTQPGVLKGKYSYSSPEQVRHQTLDGRSDIFSLGIVLHELLTLRRLFGGQSPAAALKSVMERKIIPPSELNPDVPAQLDEIVLNTLARDREERTPTAAHLNDQLEGVLASLGQPVGQTQVKNWMQTVLRENYDARQILERNVVVESRQTTTPPEIADADLPTFSGPTFFPSPLSGEEQQQTPPPRTPSSAISLTPLSVPSATADGDEPPQRRSTALVILLSSLATIFLVGLLVIAFALGRRDKIGAVEPAEIVPRQIDDTSALLVHAVPRGASLTVNGVTRNETVSPDGVLVPVKASSIVKLQISKKGYITHQEDVTALASGARNVYVTLQRVEVDRAVKPAGSDPPETARVSPPPPPPPARARRPRTPRKRPTRTQPAPPTTGAVLVRFSPETAQVFLDGRAEPGRSPVRIRGIKPGRHQVRVSAPGHESVERVVDLAAGREKSMSINLRVLAAEVDIVSKPVGASITVDGVPKGRTPLVGLRLQPRERHTIELKRAGYRDWKTSVQLEPGDNPPVMATLELVEAPEVVEAPPPAPARDVMVPTGMSGNATAGKALVASRCGKCHGSSVAKVNPRRYTQAQWSRYFATGRHKRHGMLKEHVGQSELADIKAFLVARAADVKGDTAAGMK